MKKDLHPLQFRKLTMADLSLLYTWLHTEAVKTWYAKRNCTYDQVVQKYTLRITGNSPTSSFLILYHERPIGYIQTYRICDYADYNAYVQADETAAGVDLFIGEPDYLHKGLGSRILRKFLHEIVFASEGIECCIIGPEPNNQIAIRCYEKVGFRYWKTIHLLGEAEPEYLMTLHRTEMSV